MAEIRKMSIRDRIRAMQTTLDMVDQEDTMGPGFRAFVQNNSSSVDESSIRERSIISSRTANDSTSSANEESMNNSLVQKSPAKRSGVVDIWRQREGKSFGTNSVGSSSPVASISKKMNASYNPATPSPTATNNNNRMQHTHQGEVLPIFARELRPIYTKFEDGEEKKESDVYEDDCRKSPSPNKHRMKFQNTKQNEDQSAINQRTRQNSPMGFYLVESVAHSEPIDVTNLPKRHIDQTDAIKETGRVGEFEGILAKFGKQSAVNRHADSNMSAVKTKVQDSSKLATTIESRMKLPTHTRENFQSQSFPKRNDAQRSPSVLSNQVVDSASLKGSGNVSTVSRFKNSFQNPNVSSAGIDPIFGPNPIDTGETYDSQQAKLTTVKESIKALELSPPVKSILKKKTENVLSPRYQENTGRDNSTISRINPDNVRLKSMQLERATNSTTHVSPRKAVADRWNTPRSDSDETVKKDWNKKGTAVSASNERQSPDITTGTNALQSVHRIEKIRTSLSPVKERDVASSASLSSSPLNENSKIRDIRKKWLAKASSSPMSSMSGVTSCGDDSKDSSYLNRQSRIPSFHLGSDQVVSVRCDAASRVSTADKITNETASRVETESQKSVIDRWKANANSNKPSNDFSRGSTWYSRKTSSPCSGVKKIGEPHDFTSSKRVLTDEESIGIESASTSLAGALQHSPTMSAISDRSSIENVWKVKLNTLSKPASTSRYQNGPQNRIVGSMPASDRKIYAESGNNNESVEKDNEISSTKHNDKDSHHQLSSNNDYVLGSNHKTDGNALSPRFIGQRFQMGEQRQKKHQLPTHGLGSTDSTNQAEAKSVHSANYQRNHITLKTTIQANKVGFGCDPQDTAESATSKEKPLIYGSYTSKTRDNNNSSNDGELVHKNFTSGSPQDRSFSEEEEKARNYLPSNKVRPITEASTLSSSDFLKSPSIIHNMKTFSLERQGGIYSKKSLTIDGDYTEKDCRQLLSMEEVEGYSDESTVSTGASCDPTNSISKQSFDQPWKTDDAIESKNHYEYDNIRDTFRRYDDKPEKITDSTAMTESRAKTLDYAFEDLPTPEDTLNAHVSSSKTVVPQPIAVSNNDHLNDHLDQTNPKSSEDKSSQVPLQRSSSKPRKMFIPSLGIMQFVGNKDEGRASKKTSRDKSEISTNNLSMSTNKANEALYAPNLKGGTNAFTVGNKEEGRTPTKTSQAKSENNTKYLSTHTNKVKDASISKRSTTDFILGGKQIGMTPKTTSQGKSSTIKTDLFMSKLGAGRSSVRSLSPMTRSETKIATMKDNTLPVTTQNKDTPKTDSRGKPSSFSLTLYSAKLSSALDRSTATSTATVKNVTTLDKQSNKPSEKKGQESIIAIESIDSYSSKCHQSDMEDIAQNSSSGNFQSASAQHVVASKEIPNNVTNAISPRGLSANSAFEVWGSSQIDTNRHDCDIKSAATTSLIKKNRKNFVMMGKKHLVHQAKETTDQSTTSLRYDESRKESTTVKHGSSEDTNAKFRSKKEKTLEPLVRPLDNGPSKPQRIFPPSLTTGTRHRETGQKSSKKSPQDDAAPSSHIPLSQAKSSVKKSPGMQSEMDPSPRRKIYPSKPPINANSSAHRKSPTPTSTAKSSIVFNGNSSANRKSQSPTPTGKNIIERVPESKNAKLEPKPQRKMSKQEAIARNTLKKKSSGRPVENDKQNAVDPDGIYFSAMRKQVASPLRKQNEARSRLSSEKTEASQLLRKKASVAAKKHTQLTSKTENIIALPLYSTPNSAYDSDRKVDGPVQGNLRHTSPDEKPLRTEAQKMIPLFPYQKSSEIGQMQSATSTEEFPQKTEEEMSYREETTSVQNRFVQVLPLTRYNTAEFAPRKASTPSPPVPFTADVVSFDENKELESTKNSSQSEIQRINNKVVELNLSSATPRNVLIESTIKELNSTIVHNTISLMNMQIGNNRDESSFQTKIDSLKSPASIRNDSSQGELEITYDVMMPNYMYQEDECHNWLSHQAHEPNSPTSELNGPQLPSMRLSQEGMSHVLHHARTALAMGKESSSGYSLPWLEHHVVDNRFRENQEQDTAEKVIDARLFKRYNTSSRFMDNDLSTVATPAGLTSDGASDFVQHSHSTVIPESRSDASAESSYGTLETVTSESDSRYQQQDSKEMESESDSRFQHASKMENRDGINTDQSVHSPTSLVSDQFLKEKALNMDELRSACKSVTVKDLADDLVDDVNQVSADIRNLAGGINDRMTALKEYVGRANETGSGSLSLLPKCQNLVPFDTEDVAIEVEYLDDSIDEFDEDDDDPRQDFGVCTARVDQTIEDVDEALVKLRPKLSCAESPSLPRSSVRKPGQPSLRRTQCV